MTFKSVKDDYRRKMTPLITFNRNHAYINRPAMREMKRDRVTYAHHPETRSVHMLFDDNAHYTCLNNGHLMIPLVIRKAVLADGSTQSARKLKIHILSDTLWTFDY